MTEFDFEAAVKGDAFHPAQLEIAPKGNYVFTIVEVENTRTRSDNHYPMIKLKLECVEGVQWDNLVISPNDFSFAKVLGLTDSAGLDRPEPGKDLDVTDGALTDAYVDQLMGKQVGGIVRDKTEADNRQDSQTYGQDITRPRVQGYVEPSKITAQGPAPSNGAAASSSVVAAADRAAEDIPF